MVNYYEDNLNTHQLITCWIPGCSRHQMDEEYSRFQAHECVPVSTYKSKLGRTLQTISWLTILGIHYIRDVQEIKTVNLKTGLKNNFPSLLPLTSKLRPVITSTYYSLCRALTIWSARSQWNPRLSWWLWTPQTSRLTVKIHTASTLHIISYGLHII